MLFGRPKCQKTNATCKALYDQLVEKGALLPLATTGASMCGGKVLGAAAGGLF
jgi:hypothetical protein